MGRIIAIANNKGGTGKTTTAVNMSAALRLSGYDILLIDYDSQANASCSLRVDDSAGTMYDVIRNGKKIKPVHVLPKEGNCGCLDIVPSSPDLSTIETNTDNADKMLKTLASYLSGYKDTYDFILIDTPPLAGALQTGALLAADEVIITVRPQYLDVVGLSKIIDRITKVNTFRKAPLKYKVLLTMFDVRKGLHRATAEQIKNASVPAFNTVIRDTVALGEAPDSGMDVFSYDRSSRGAQDYAALANEYLENIGA